MKLTLKNVHGTFNSFKEMGAAIGMKAPKGKPTEAIKCPICGQDMSRVGNTNVCVCKNISLRDEKLKGKDVQVFGVCNFTLLSEA